MHIFNIHTSIQQNKRVFSKKVWEEFVGQMTYPVCDIYFQKRGKTPAREVKWHEILPQPRVEMLTKKLYRSFSMICERELKL
jgi:hypothetical protein